MTGGKAGETLELMSLLWELDHRLERASKRMAREIGITGPQRLAIRIVGQYPGISAGELADLLHFHPSTLTGVLRRLVDHGTVRREADPNDARRARFTLTAKGRRYDARKKGTVEAAVEQTLRALTPRDLASTRAFLKKLAASLE